MQYHIAKKLKKSNELIFISSYQAQVAPRQCAPGNIEDLAKMCIYKLTYGNGITLCRLSHTKEKFAYFSDTFLKKNFDEIITETERDKLLKGFDVSQFKVLDMSRYRVLFFFDVADYSADRDAFTQELAGIFGIIRKHFPENEIACKYHPGYEGDEISLDMGEELPEFIPAEVLYNDNIKVYLGICSAALSNVEKGTVISLIGLIAFDNKTYREKLKEVLLRTSHTKMLFPKSLDEFEQILVGIRSS
jgi:hypothetical protein